MLLALLGGLLVWVGPQPAEMPAGPVCIAFVGDLMAHCTQSSGAQEAAGGTGYDFTAAFDRVRGLLSEADLAVGNLETPLDGRQEGYCFPRFSAPTQYADALLGAGFDVLLLANNHALDRGEDGLRRTIEAVRARRMLAVGAAPEAAQASIEVAGRKVAVLGFTRFVNLRCRGTTCPLLLHDRESLDAAAARVRELSSTHDIVVVLLHWMSEDRLRPSREEREQAAALVAAGAQAVVGSHSHVLGPARCLSADSEGDDEPAPTAGGMLPAQAPPAASTTGTPLFVEAACDPAAPSDAYVRYSLGNFVHAMRRFPTKLGGIDTVCFAPGKDGRHRVVSARFTPTMTARNGSRPRSFQAVPLAELEQACQGDAAARRKAGVDCDEVHQYRKFLDKQPGMVP